MEYNEENIIKFFNNELKDLKEENQKYVIYETRELIDIFGLELDTLDNKKKLYDVYSNFVKVAKNNKVPMAVNGKIYNPNNEDEGVLELDYGDLEYWLYKDSNFKHPLTDEVMDIINNEYQLKLSMWIFKV